MARGTLNAARGGGEESKAIERANRLLGRRTEAEVDWSLRNSAFRSTILELEPRPHTWQIATSLSTERAVQDRLLAERTRAVKLRG